MKAEVINISWMVRSDRYVRSHSFRPITLWYVTWVSWRTDHSDLLANHVGLCTGRPTLACLALARQCRRRHIPSSTWGTHYRCAVLWLVSSWRRVAAVQWLGSAEHLDAISTVLIEAAA